MSHGSQLPVNLSLSRRRPPSGLQEPAWWFIFCEAKLLVQSSERRLTFLPWFLLGTWG